MSMMMTRMRMRLIVMMILMMMILMILMLMMTMMMRKHTNNGKNTLKSERRHSPGLDIILRGISSPGLCRQTVWSVGFEQF